MPLNLDALYSLIPEYSGRARFIIPLGNSANHVWARGDSPSNFYLLGSMGMSTPLALGIALGTRLPVVAIEGDGGLMMNLGSLWTAHKYGPANLKIVIIDNGGYVTTGGQPISFDHGKSLNEVVAAAGFTKVRAFDQTGQEPALWEWLLKAGTRIAVARVEHRVTSHPTIPLRPADISTRFAQGTAYR